MSFEPFELNGPYVAIGTERGFQTGQTVDPAATLQNLGTLRPVDHYDANRRDFQNSDIVAVAPADIPIRSDAWGIDDKMYALGGGYADYLKNANEV